MATKTIKKKSTGKSVELARPAAGKATNGNGSHGSTVIASEPPVIESKNDRVPVMKTYKIFIGGKFPRTESGRYYQPLTSKGKPLANVGRSSRKDIRDAVIAARSAQGPWAGRTAYNRAQILYRIAEMLEGRSLQFVNELELHGATKRQAEIEVTAAIDRWIYFAGWCDKYQQLFSSVNPVASSHFNFSVLEATGVVGLMAPANSGLVGLSSTIAPIIAGGNAVVVVASEQLPLPAVTLTEVLATSDLPGGVVNLMTGLRSELLKPLVQHMDINNVVICDATAEEKRMVQIEGTANLKRTIFPKVKDWASEEAENPYAIMDTQEVKTTWHPIEKGQGGGGGY